MATTISDKAAWLHGPAEHCQLEAKFPNHPWRLVLLGPPGVGKGTQALFLSADLTACHLSTGDVFRAAKCSSCEPSPVMKTALQAMQHGELVTDETVLELVRERAGCLKCGFGFLLDGFPRTLAQAQALDGIMAQVDVQLDAVVSYELGDEEIVKRLAGRRTCSSCAQTFHVDNKPPKVNGVCDNCGGELYQRSDDNITAIQTRLKAYHALTQPLEEFYEKKGLLLRINAAGAPSQIHSAALAALRAKCGDKAKAAQ